MCKDIMHTFLACPCRYREFVPCEAARLEQKRMRWSCVRWLFGPRKVCRIEVEKRPAFLSICDACWREKVCGNRRGEAPRQGGRFTTWHDETDARVQAVLAARGKRGRGASGVVTDAGPAAGASNNNNINMQGLVPPRRPAQAVVRGRRGGTDGGEGRQRGPPPVATNSQQGHRDNSQQKSAPSSQKVRSADTPVRPPSGDEPRPSIYRRPSGTVSPVSPAMAMRAWSLTPVAKITAMARRFSKTRKAE